MRHTCVTLGVWLLLFGAAPAIAAQSAGDTVPVVSPVILQRVASAQAMLERGDGDDARTLLDSLVRVTPPGSADLAEVLFWRATLAERAADAERDWRRIVVEIPLSPRTPDVLLRLGDLELVRQRPERARSYLERVVREFPATKQRVRAAMWVARSYVEQRDLANGCRAFAGVAREEIPEGELQLQADELRRQCAAVVTDSAVVTGNAVTPASSPVGGGRFTVQVGAFETQREAQESVTRLTGRGYDARIDGEQRPFRVRIGRFATRAEATKLLAKLKASGVDAFVAELRP